MEKLLINELPSSYKPVIFVWVDDDIDTDNEPVLLNEAFSQGGYQPLKFSKLEDAIDRLQELVTDFYSEILLILDIKMKLPVKLLTDLRISNTDDINTTAQAYISFFTHLYPNLRIIFATRYADELHESTKYYIVHKINEAENIVSLICQVMRMKPSHEIGLLLRPKILTKINSFKGIVIKITDTQAIIKVNIEGKEIVRRMRVNILRKKCIDFEGAPITIDILEDDDGIISSIINLDKIEINKLKEDILSTDTKILSDELKMNIKLSD